MNNNDKVILWCVAFSTSIFFLYYTAMRIKFYDILKGKSIMDVSEYIKEFNDSKISTYQKDKKYFKVVLFKLLDVLLSPYLFIYKLFDLFAYIIVWIIKWFF